VISNPLQRLVRCLQCGVPALAEDGNPRSDDLVSREWLVTNGLGGYASGTVAGVTTRRYHGLLVASLPAPFGRMVMLTHLSEQFRLPDGSLLRFGGEEWASGQLDLPGLGPLREFRLEAGLPVWRFDLGNALIDKQVFLPHGQNTVHVTYRLVEGRGPIRLKVRPSMHFRSYEGPVNLPLTQPYTLTIVNDRIDITAGGNLPALHLHLHGTRPAFTVEGMLLRQLLYRIESQRGYDSVGDLWSPGYFRVDLLPDQPVTLTASTEPWDVIQALDPEDALSAEYERRSRLLSLAGEVASDPVSAELVLAADQFLITPAGRVEEATRARAAGDEVRTIIAGYHWFTDWGRDTMISLEGLTLTTGRHREAGYILRTFAHYVRDGLIPNYFPDGENEGVYHTADATLWFFHALDRYLAVTNDENTLERLLPVLTDVIEHHLRGTRFGIGFDPADGLLRQGQEGYQLTWMDAKVGDWVVTPRRGKAVEINALWYNALRLMEGWQRRAGDEEAARRLGKQAEQARQSFNRRFWNEAGGYLFDVVDGESGDDPACRPNQLLAISLPHPVLEGGRWRSVLDVVERELLTPVGLRSLAPGHPAYRSRYDGDLWARDAAYHQGTVWGWLIGPFIDAWLKVHPEDRAFDAEMPYAPRGCAAQAWSVAEVLRCWALTARPEPAAESAPR
jgi:predicted glycogen debranching enzyme